MSNAIIPLALKVSPNKMCFTLTGRWQTRLVTLLGPLTLAWLFAVRIDKLDYWLVFGLMLAVGLTLDVGVYGWLIGYQPRWLTLLLATLEFFILKWIMEWPYPLEIRLRTRQGLEFYLLAWLVIWLTLHVVIPRLWPRWAEDGGEFRLARTRHALRRYQPLGTLTERRRAYGYAVAALVFTLLPWLSAALLTPPDHVFTGLLLNEPGHLQALAEVTAVVKGGPIRSLAGVIGWVAHQGWWSPLPIYQLAWLVSALACLLGLQLGVRGLTLPAVMAAALLATVIPAPWLMVAAGGIWLVNFTPLPRLSLPQAHRWLVIGVSIGMALGWGLIWLRLPAAPLLRLAQGEAEALTWLRQSVPAETTVAAAPELQPLVAALGGQLPADEVGAMLVLTTGPRCSSPSDQIRFRHGTVCVLTQTQIGEVQP